MSESSPESSGQGEALQRAARGVRNAARATGGDRPEVGGAPVIPLMILITGGYLLWFGVHYWRDKTQKWPTDPVKSVLQGKGVPARSPQVSTSAQLDALVSTTTSAPAAGQAAATITIPSGKNLASYISLGSSMHANRTDTPANNRVLAQNMAAAFANWTGDEWGCLNSGWSEESGFSDSVSYRGGGVNVAYGIPQSNPGTKMASAGADWQTNPATQILWGLSYIQRTYGSPSKVPHWTPSGVTAGYVGY